MTDIMSFGDLPISGWRVGKTPIMLAVGNGYFQSLKNAHNIDF